MLTGVTGLVAVTGTKAADPLATGDGAGLLDAVEGLRANSWETVTDL